MKITKLQTQLVNVPLAKPIRTAIHDMRSVGCILVSLHSDEGRATAYKLYNFSVT